MLINALNFKFIYSLFSKETLDLKNYMFGVCIFCWALIEKKFTELHEAVCAHDCDCDKASIRRFLQC